MRSVRSTAIASLAAILLAAGCTTTPSPSPSATAAQPTGPASPGPTTAPTPGPSNAATACAIAPQDGRLLSDRLVGASLQSSPDGDHLAFLFGPRTTITAGSTGHLQEVSPPFVQAGSGQPVEVEGDRFFQVRFEGMWIDDESGTPTYQGSREIRSSTGPIAEAVVVEEFEGYVTWIVGFRGNGCVTLSSPTSDELVVTVTP
jgi:hypothetical protein